MRDESTHWEDKLCVKISKQTNKTLQKQQEQKKKKYKHTTIATTKRNQNQNKQNKIKQNNKRLKAVETSH